MKITQCTVEGCTRGGKISRGMCTMHYTRMWRQGLTPRLRMRERLLDRFTAGLAEMPNGCVEWTLSTNPSGYGQVNRGRTGQGTALTHRLAWELANGPIPPGMCVLHHCDNPPCCQTNPTEGYPDGHLFLGTRADNMRDKVAKGRSRNGNEKKTHCSRNHPYDEANTYLTPSGRRDCRACMKVRTAARDIRNRGA